MQLFLAGPVIVHITHAFSVSPTTHILVSSRPFDIMTRPSKSSGLVINMYSTPDNRSFSSSVLSSEHLSTRNFTSLGCGSNVCLGTVAFPQGFPFLSNTPIWFKLTSVFSHWLANASQDILKCSRSKFDRFNEWISFYWNYPSMRVDKKYAQKCYNFYCFWLFCMWQCHTTGDVTRVSVMPRKVQWKSGMPRIGVGDAEIKINEKWQKFLFV